MYGFKNKAAWRYRKPELRDAISYLVSGGSKEALSGEL